MENICDENVIKENFKKVTITLKELGQSSNIRQDIITKRFGGKGAFLAYASSQIAVAFKYDRNINEAFLRSSEKRRVLTMVGACTEVGYMIAEEKYEQQIKTLEAKLMIAESEIEKLKRGNNGKNS